ncbi:MULTISPECIES: AMP-binding protein [unclassified Sphingomonas]|uniref:AMP-binding protein n=1 Tax=unclassified Sphingomonas TaxID=196159 RepID=UPI0007017A9D|nr:MULTISPECIES: AMP-binding protein [unclassified Sphingomonas]KQX18606.1 hypothetical protein ASD17_15810 [Sphingomonas sp. Root1294]KQY72071.1 hypothetical protein ASD39_19165 [Sphingomonas sp. Root50]KRB94660.1 hypothetical protein ASE22_01590 [Sphingomonas sp. Root720]
MYITQGIHRAVQIRAQADATVFDGRRHSWQELQDRVARLASALRALGLEAGGRVALIAGNTDLYIEAMYATWWAGGVLVPGNYRWTETEHCQALEETKAHVLIVGEDLHEVGQSLAERCGIVHLVVLAAGDASTPDGLLRTEDMIASATPMKDACRQSHALCMIVYTGGTTGRSKGVMLSHYNLISNILDVNAIAPFPPEPVFLHSAPMFHLAGAGAVLGTTMFAGTHVVLPAFSPAAVIEAIEREAVTVAMLVPTMFVMLRRHLRERLADLGSMRRVRYGTTAISAELLTEAMEMFPNAEFQQGYGQTELSPSVAVLEPRFHHPSDSRSYLRSAGRQTMAADIRIVDEQLKDVALGQVGEIMARGPGVMLGYLNQPQLTAETIVNGWVRTGDAGYMDEAGFLYVVDRLKDMIISGGENVYSSEVENALASHPAIAECAVIGRPDPIWGEGVHAIVRLVEGSVADKDELVRHCKSLISSYKCPRSIEFWESPLPRSPQGKLLKGKLRLTV